MAACSLRCVAIAYRTYDLDKVPTDVESLDKWVLPEDELVLLAIVGIKVYIFTPLFLFWIMWHSLSLSLSPPPPSLHD